MLIYIHIPKCAGTSVLAHFATVYGKDSIFRSGLGRMHDDMDDLPEDVAVLTGHMPFGAHLSLDGRPYQYVTMLRDPLDRMLSLYYYRKLRKPSEMPGVEEMSFEEFMNVDHAEMDNEQVRYVSGCMELDYYPVSVPVGQRELDAAIRNVEEHDMLVGIQEQFQRSMLVFAERLGWDTVPRHGIFNRASRKGQPPIDPGTLQWARGRLQWDYMLYDYARERLRA